MQTMQRNSFVKILTLVLITVGVVALDQLTKLLCVRFISLGESVAVMPGVLNLTYIQNKGAAFGSLSESRWIFMAASFIMIILIVCYVLSNKIIKLSTVSALSMIVGGGIGNMIDRIAYGYVVDFVDIKFLPFWKWIFNIADSFVCVGAVLLVILYIVHETENKKGKKNDVKTES